MQQPRLSGPVPTDQVELGDPASTGRWLRALFETPLMFSGLLDVDGDLLDANPLSVEGCGLARDDVLRRPFWTGGWWAPDPALSAQVQTWCRDVARTGSAVRTTSAYYTGAGERRTVDLSLTAVTSGAGSVQGIVATGVDVTQARAASSEHDRAEQMRAAVESNRVIGAAVGIMMARRGLSQDEAFALLSRASQRSNRKLRDIAAAIVSGPGGADLSGLPG